MADGDALSSSCDEEREELCPVSHLELRVIEENGCKGTGQDEELTSLSWLQNTNLLQSIHVIRRLKLDKHNNFCIISRYQLEDSH